MKEQIRTGTIDRGEKHDIPDPVSGVCCGNDIVLGMMSTGGGGFCVIRNVYHRVEVTGLGQC